MAFQPQLRISPSGPVASDENPLAQYGGNRLGFSSSSTVEYVGKVGPSDAGAVYAPSVALSTGSFASQYANVAVMASKQPVGDQVSYSKGTWMVELELGVAFATAPPSTDDAAVLNFSFQFKALDGTNIGSPSTYVASPLPRTGTGTYGGDVVHSTNIKFVVEVTDAMVVANGNAPLDEFQILVTRANGLGGNDYIATSGWLELSRDTNVYIHRIR